VWSLWAMSKRAPPGVSRTIYAFAEGSTAPINDYKLAANIFCLLFITEK